MMSKKSKTAKRRFWIPAAICVTAFLVAVSILAPKNITGVFAAEAESPVTVEPSQTQTDGDDPVTDPVDDPENPVTDDPENPVIDNPVNPAVDPVQVNEVS